jgi:hypothetical protein
MKQPAGRLRIVSGDRRLYSLRLHQTPEGSTWQRCGLPEGWTMVLSGKLAPGGETAYFTNSEWAEVGSGTTLAYTATLDFAVASGFWGSPATTPRVVYFDVEIRDATNTVRGTWQFEAEVHRENYGSGDEPADPDEPFLDRPAADNIYLSFDAAQTLTDGQATQAEANLKAASIPTPDRLAKRTSLGWLLARAFDTGDDSNGFQLKGLAQGTVTVSVAGSADQYTFDEESFPPTGITEGMYLFGGFPEGTTVIDIDGGIITTSAGLLASGTATVFASTSSADPRPKLTLTREGTPILTIAYDGTITGPAASLSNLIVDGGNFTVDVDGNVTALGSISPSGPVYLNAGSQGIEHSAYSMLGLDDQGNSTFGIYSQSGDSKFIGDMWLGAFSGTGQGLLINRTGIFGYDANGGNLFSLNTETGTAILSGLQLGSYSLVLGGNVSFTATGRFLANAATAAAARSALSLDTGNSPTFSGLTLSTLSLGGFSITTTAIGRTLLSAADAAAAREALGLTRMTNISVADASWVTPTAISGAVAVNTYSTGARTGNIASGTAGFGRFYLNVSNTCNVITGSRTTVNYSSSFRMAFRACVFVNTNASSKVTFLVATATSTVAHDLAAVGLAIQAYGNGTSTFIRLQSHSGSASSNGTAVAITAADDTFYDFELIWTAGTGATLYRDGTSLCSVSTTLATGNGVSGATCPMVLFENAAGATDQTLVRLLTLAYRRG